MSTKTTSRVKHFGALLSVLGLVSVVGISDATAGQSTEGFAFDPAEVTFHRDIEPILQRSCQNCHREASVAPMSLLTYAQARPWARAMKRRTAMGPRAGVMPPWYIERDIGIQEFKLDPSLSDEEVAMIAAWADNGAPQGNPADAPTPRDFGEGG